MLSTFVSNIERRIAWLWSIIFDPKEYYIPNSGNYVGHINARYRLRAKCTCLGQDTDIMCPFHGR